MNPGFYVAAIGIGLALGVGITLAAIYTYERISGRWFLFNKPRT